MARQRKVQFQSLTPFTHRDFSGLNHTASPYNLELGELHRALDVRVDKNGGICTRKAVTPFATKGMPSSVCALIQFESKDGDSYVIMQDDDGNVWHIKNGPGPVVESPIPKNEDGRCCYTGWQTNDYLFVSNGTKVWRWDGASDPEDVTTTQIHALGDEQDVTNLGVPAACDGVNFLDTVFIAAPKINTVDPRAVYWSAPVIEYPDGELKGERDFSEFARFSFTGGAPSDEIVKLLPCGQNLLVLKSHSVHAVRANDNAQVAEFFETDLLSDAGVVGPKAVACELGTAFLFDQRRGVIMVTEDGTTTQMFEQLYDLIEDKRLGDMKKIAMAAFGRTLYVSVPLDGSEHNSRTFVYDFDVKGWTEYSIGFDCFLDYCPSSDNAKSDGGLLGYVADPPSLVIVDDDDSLVDNFGPEKRRFRPEFATKWWDHDLPYIPKRWVSAEGIVVSEGQVEFCVIPTYDWDESNAAEKRFVSSDPAVDECPKFDDCENVKYPKETIIICDLDGEEVTHLPCDDGPVYGPAVSTGRRVSFGKFGKGRGLQLHVIDNGSDASWCVSVFTLTYKAMSVRSC